MTAQAPAIQFVLYSEDRADANSDFAVLRELLRGMLKHLRADVKLNHVRIAPVEPVREKRVCGSHWKATPWAKSPGAQEARRGLVRAVATELRLGRVVFFHVDADAVWSQRKTCENAREHWPRFIRDVQTVLGQPGQACGEQAPIEHTLVLAMPFYEMESWAFANISYLRRHVVDPDELARLDRWEEELGRLDEEANTKDCLSVGDALNAELVQLKNGFPVHTLAQIPRSYAETLNRLRESSIVVRGLEEAASRPF